MKLFDQETNPSTQDCATQIMETVPLVMRTIRAEMRRGAPSDLSVPQFRALGYLGRHPGASLSDVAGHLGLTLPSISKLMDRLVNHGFVIRRSATGDRRRLSIELTPVGQEALQEAGAVTLERLAELVETLSPDEQATIIQAMHSLRDIFSTTTKTEVQNDSK